MTSLEQVLRKGPAASKALIDALGISQPTLSRRIHALAEAVLTMGKGRATRYALRRAVAEETYFPLYQVDEQGTA